MEEPSGAGLRKHGETGQKEIFKGSGRTLEETAGSLELSPGVQIPADPVPGPCDLEKICREAVSASRPLWEESGNIGANQVRIRTYLRNVKPVIGVHDEIRGILIALIANSVEAMPDGGDIYLTVEEHDGRANVYVQDSGNGVPDSIRSRVFDPFFTTKDRCHEGLGLTRASETVRRYGGEMEVLSRRGGGATFIIRFPLVSDGKPAKRSFRRKPANLRILLVAADGIVKNLIFRFITDKGAHVSQVAGAVEGIRVFRKNDFDLVIVEAGIDGLDHRTFFSLIREERPCTALVIVGADSDSTRSGPPDVRPDALVGFPMYMDSLYPLLCDAVEARRARK